jgi:hypothetical protein
LAVIFGEVKNVCSLAILQALAQRKAKRILDNLILMFQVLSFSPVFLGYLQPIRGIFNNPRIGLQLNPFKIRFEALPTKSLIHRDTLTVAHIGLSIILNPY